jgi:hypothetical protein
MKGRNAIIIQLELAPLSKDEEFNLTGNPTYSFHRALL